MIGKPLPRLDGADKARGQTVFGIDVKQPGMLYAALATCPVLGGKVATFDASSAQKRPGVRKVVDIGDGVAVIADHYWIREVGAWPISRSSGTKVRRRVSIPRRSTRRSSGEEQVRARS